MASTLPPDKVPHLIVKIMLTSVKTLCGQTFSIGIMCQISSILNSNKQMFVFSNASNFFKCFVQYMGTTFVGRTNNLHEILIKESIRLIYFQSTFHCII